MCDLCASSHKTMAIMHGLEFCPNCVGIALLEFDRAFEERRGAMETKQIISEHIVSPEELMELTGYTLPAKQAKCLRAHGIYYIERKDGQIRTTWYHVNHPDPHAINTDGFDLGAIA